MARRGRARVNKSREKKIMELHDQSWGHYLLFSLLTVLLYVALAKFALAFLTIWPEQKVILWPASGWALTAVIAWGRGLLLPLGLAHFLCFLPTQQPLQLLLSVVGAIGQPLLGSIFFGRFCPHSYEIGSFKRCFIPALLLSGPVSCALSAILFSLSQNNLEAMNSALFLREFLILWVGQTFGVVAFAPFLLLWSTGLKTLYSGRIMLFLTVFFLHLGVIISFLLAIRVEKLRIKAMFAKEIGLIEKTVKKSFKLYFENLYSIQQFFYSSDEVTRDEFREFVRPILIRHPEFQALEWTPRVQHAQRTEFERRARRELGPLKIPSIHFHTAIDRMSGKNGAKALGQNRDIIVKDFQFRQFDDHSHIVSRQEAPEYFPIYYAEPLEGNEVALGFDIASSPLPRENLIRARDSGQLSLSDPIRLVQETNAQRGVVAYLPLYDQTQSTGTVTERRQAFKGIIAGVFRMGEVMRQTLAGQFSQGVDFYVEDIDVPGSQRFLYSTVKSPQSLEEKGRKNGSVVIRDIAINLGGQRWRIRCYLSENFQMAYRSFWPMLGLYLGVLLATSISLFILMIIERSKIVEYLVRERTSELSILTQRANFLANIGKSFADKIFEKDHILKGLCDLCVPEIADGCLLIMTDKEAANCFHTQHIDAGKRDILKNWENKGRESECPPARHENVMPKIPLLLSSITPQQLREHLGQEELILLFESLEVQDLMILPIKVMHKSIGGIFLFNHRNHQHFKKRDLEFAEELIHRVETFIQNADLHKETQDAIRVRDEFISVASHELRTPLTPLKIYFQMLRRLLNEELGLKGHPKLQAIFNYLDPLDRQIDRMNRLVEDLLNVNYLSSGQFIFHREKFDLANLVDEILHFLQEDLRKANCLAEAHYPRPILGLWDKMKIEQVIYNLITNAMKYGAGRPIRIFMEVKENLVILHVKDQGIGIAPEDQTKIFRLFERAAPFKKYQGMGLGLYISKQIVDAHGGRIYVESELGAGAEFIVELPLVP